MGFRLRLAPYRVALAVHAGHARRAWSERAGLLVRLEDGSGLVGQGEAAPLPGYADDDLSATRAALEAWQGRVLDVPPAGVKLDWLTAWREALPAGTPSATFALETALLDWIARREGLPLHRLLGRWMGRPGAPLAPVPLAALLPADDLEPLEAAERALARGYSTLKLKLGRPGCFEDELAAARRLRERLGRDVCLRFDANGGFSELEAAARLADLAPLEPEFVEEPVARGAPLPDAPAVPLALDESLRDVGLTLTPELAASQRVIALVLKPGVLGGLLAALRLAQHARALGLAPVVSHAFEGPVGFAAACELALALAETSHAAGLAPHAALDAWTAPLPAASAGARLVAHSAPGLGLPLLSPPP